MEFDHVFFQNFENRCILIFLLDCEQYGKNQYKKKEHNQQFSVESVLVTFILFKCHRTIDNSIHFYLFVMP